MKEETLEARVARLEQFLAEFHGGDIAKELLDAGRVTAYEKHDPNNGIKRIHYKSAA